MDNKDKILIISNGKESILEFHKDLISDLISDNFKVTIINSSLNRDDLEESFSLDEINSIELITGTPSLKIKNIFSLFKTIFTQLNLTQYKYAICFMINTSILFGIFSIYFKKTEFVATIEGLGSSFKKVDNYILNKIKLLSIKLLLNIVFFNFKKFIFVNEDNQSFLNQIVSVIRNKKQLLLKNGNGIRLFKNKLKQENFKDKNINFIMVSRLMKEKGLYEFIDASYKVKNKYPTTHFTHIGGEPIYPKKMDVKLRSKINNANHIEFLGSKRNVAEILLTKDIFVLPSISEGFSASIMEAMATGLFIITSNAPGCKQSITEEYEGILFNTGDQNDLFDKMCICCENIENIRQNSLKIRNSALRRFDSKLNQRKIKDFILA